MNRRLLSCWILAIPISFACHADDAHHSDSPRLTPLMKAARRVQKLISQGADVRERTKDGETALYEAIEHRNPDRDNLPVVDALLKVGADPNEVETYGLSPLVISLTRNYGTPEVTLRLLGAGARVPKDCGEGDSVLSLATQDSSVAVMRALLVKGAAVNCRNSPPLYWAALNGQTDRVALLLQYGADPLLRIKGTGQTALEAAVATNPDHRVQLEFAKTRQLLQEAARRRQLPHPSLRLG